MVSYKNLKSSNGFSKPIIRKNIMINVNKKLYITPSIKSEFVTKFKKNVLNISRNKKFLTNPNKKDIQIFNG